jgi:hypothetical protein
MKSGELRPLSETQKKGIEKERYEQKLAFVKTLLQETDFDDSKIARLASVTTDFVAQVRQTN